MTTVEELSTEVALLENEAAPLRDRLLTILRRHQDVKQASSPSRMRVFIDAGGVAALAAIVSSHWPPQAAFEDSPCPADTVLLLTPDLDPQLLGWGPVSGQAARALRGKATVLYRSLRRVALDMLTDIVEKAAGGAVQVLQERGLFSVSAFPNMISTSMERYVPGQTATEQCEHPDQGQQIAERLLWLAATAAAQNQAVARFMTECAVCINKAFKDPWQVQWEPNHNRKLTAAATAAAAQVVASVKQRYSVSTSRIWPDTMPAGMGKATIKEKLVLLDHLGSHDVMTGTYAHFMNAVCKAASEVELLSMVEEGDANSKVIHCVGHPAVGPMGSMHLDHVYDKLMAAWDKKALQLSKQMATTRKAGAEKAAASLREEGNACFKMADFEAALAAYMAALAETPEDSRLYCNISLTYLKLGKINEAYDVARSGLAHDPVNSKAWVRLGDACREAGRWQLAALCYSAAKMLGGGNDPDIESRHAKAISCLDRAWDWNEIPPPWDVAGHAKWLKLQSKPGVSDAAWLKKAQKESSKLTHTSRSIATKLKTHLLAARAMAAAKAGHLAALPAINEWQLSWGDMPMKAPVTGQIRYMIQVADCVASADSDPALTPAPSLLEGQPGLLNCIHALAMACFHPPNGMPPNKPSSLNLSYRMLPIYASLRQVFTDSWGIPVTIETMTDAQRAAVQYDTHYLGRNFEDIGYHQEQLFKIASKMEDPYNDHTKLPPPSSSSSSTPANSNTAQQQAASGGGNSSAASAKKKQRQQQQQLGLEFRGATAAATEYQRQSRSGASNDGTTGGRLCLRGMQLRTAQQHTGAQQQQQQPRRPVILEDSFDGFQVHMGGVRNDANVRSISCTLTQHCRMDHGAGWSSLIEAVRQGAAQGEDTQALQRIVNQL